MPEESSALHRIERLRHEPKRRLLTVVSTTRLTPHMLRIDFASGDLHDFVSASPDDHVKIFVPDVTAADGLAMRDYTPRAFDAAGNVLTIDFALHEAGPATLWAKTAKPGDTLLIGGPRGSAVVPDDFDFYLLVGDETALPAIGRRIEGLRDGVAVTTVVVLDDADDRQSFETSVAWQPRWVYRTDRRADDATLLREALETWQAPPGDGYVWIAAEAQTARLLRRYMIEDRGHPASWLKAAGYWISGRPGATEKLDG